MGQKVLIAEDDCTSRTILAAMLTKWGYDPVEVDNGAEAWKVMQKADAPKLVLLDWNMPELNGLDVARMIRRVEMKVTPYIIMLTGRSEKSDIVDSLEAGANDHVSKPYDHNELMARLATGRHNLELQLSLISKIEALQKAMAEIKTLRGIVPICAGCKKIRDDKGFWQQVESYVTCHSEAMFSHGMCPDCARKWYPDIADEADELARADEANSAGEAKTMTHHKPTCADRKAKGAEEQ
ncbi:MAG: response regulator [bacterium]